MPLTKEQADRLYDLKKRVARFYPDNKEISEMRDIVLELIVLIEDKETKNE